MFNTAVQTLIAVSGLLALLMVTSTRPAWRKWAPPVGIVGQPGWLWSAWQADQWGMFVLSVAYTLVWLRSAVKEWR